MSRQWEIDLDRPLSDEDKEYLYSRNQQHLVSQSEARFEGEDPEEDPGPSLADAVNGLSNDDLNAELKKRGLEVKGKMDARRERLMQYVLEHEQDEGEDDEDDEDETEDPTAP